MPAPASLQLQGAPAPPPPPPTQRPSHQRTKSSVSVLRSLMGHRRSPSDGTELPSSFAKPTTQVQLGNHGTVFDPAPSPSRPHLELNTNFTLGERQQNSQPQQQRDLGLAPPSPQKTTFSSITRKAFASKEKDPSSPTKAKKTKSSTNLKGLLSRPKSTKNLKQLISEEEVRAAKDKENRTPPRSATHDLPPPPIYAEFSSQQQHYGSPAQSPVYMGRQSSDSPGRPAAAYMGEGSGKPRPKSFQPYGNSMEVRGPMAPPLDTRSRRGAAEEAARKRMTWGRGETQSGSGGKNGVHVLGPRAKSTSNMKTEPAIDPEDIDKHLEAMLDRRNIPENQRYKMRNLNNTIKMEFIRQDWAEAQAKLERPQSNDGLNSTGSSGSERIVGKKKKHMRGLSLTLGKSANKAPPSPTKKQRTDGNLGRHFRSKSTESLTNERPTSSGETSTSGNGFFAKVKPQQRPADFVSYLRKAQKPELVEVGKLHKLRLLLRNETVAWTEEFIEQGGMKEIVELLHRIMAVEWREEHEDALLHENLLCLKALCTTALAVQYLHSIHATLFPALLRMIFDPERKGPSEFTTRNIVTSVLLTYIESAPPQERLSRAKAVLGFLRDPEPKEEERPVSFVLDMQRQRPYRVWCKEAVSVTKEVFWIFLHNLNIIALPSSTPRPSPRLEQGGGDFFSARNGNPGHEAPSRGGIDDQLAYMARHFPQERPPVPAAPYVGGVEWDATNYLASHLDLMNAIIACTGPTAAQRNALRAQLRISGWERCLGGSLRLCKEKFYGAVHDGLRTWVAAAAEDGWDVRDVRYGPPPESRSASPVKKPGARKDEPPPRIEMPKLDFGMDANAAATPAAVVSRSNDDLWLS
ncbi:GTPase-binding protein rid1 [Podospora conica]|nr:GTPase-binding protein rid1 [Schizothecium conicum]